MKLVNIIKMVLGSFTITLTEV